jgi:antitoxin (DNA-binding transcriptional repressor) of toxin-antitoxin stability system
MGRRSVSVSELKTHLSRYLRLVRRGEVLLVRDRDRIVARVEAAGPGEGGTDTERLDRLEGSGVLRRRRRSIDPTLLRKRVRASADVIAALLAERDEGR